MKIFKENVDVISEESVWVCLDKEYLYIKSTLFGLLWIIITEYKQDKHLVG